MRDSDAPIEELTARFAGFAQHWYHWGTKLTRDACQANGEERDRAQEANQVRHSPAPWVFPHQRLVPTAHGMDFILAAHTQEVTAMCFEPGGHHLLTASLDGSLGLWDLRGIDSARPVVPRRGRPVADAAFSPDGQRIAAATGDSVVLYDPSLEQVVSTLHHPCTVEKLLWAPDAKSILTLANNVLLQWNVDRSSVIAEHGWPHHNWAIILRDFACSPAGFVACAGGFYWYWANNAPDVDCGCESAIIINNYEIQEVDLPGLSGDDNRGECDLLCRACPLPSWTIVRSSAFSWPATARVSEPACCDSRASIGRRTRTSDGAWTTIIPTMAESGGLPRVNCSWPLCPRKLGRRGSGSFL